jgi:protein-L-isoaspartate(D-aspartate) O-methyltransferase
VNEPVHLLHRLVDRLVARGDLSEEWKETFLSVPRHAFIPETVWQQDESIDGANDMVPLSRSDDPEAWLELAYTDDAIVIQVDDGHPVGPGLLGDAVTSSASMPTVVARMLAALQVHAGMKVCEIGTGSGYNAALLAQQVGARNVVTIEVDRELGTRANKVLTDCGYGEVTVVTADGEQGYPPGAPYDRIISTASVYQVPYAWVDQTQPGGLVITPWATAYYNGGLLELTVAEDGTAVGRIVDKASFMSVRDQRLPRVSLGADVYDEGQATVREAELHPYDVAGHYDVSMSIGILVPRCKHLYTSADNDSNEAILWFLDPWSRSWASLHHSPDVASRSYRVRQLGPRNLWDEVEAAYRWWSDAGRPAAEQWRFQVTPRGQHVFLGTCPERSTA